MSLGMNIRKYRERKGWSQEYLAEATGISQTSIAKYETNLQVPNINIAAKLSKVLDCTMEELIAIDAEDKER